MIKQLQEKIKFGITRSVKVMFLTLIFSVLSISIVAAQDDPPPLPLHGIEGSGGIFSTYSAYLVNTAPEGKILGKPSIAGFYVSMGHGRALEAVSLTETLWDRLELGYAFDRFDIGDLPEDTFKATGLQIQDDYVGLHNFNARFALLKEGEYDLPYLPAVTAGVHYKYNDTEKDINSDLKGTLKAIGIESNDGVDFTLYATKLIKELPRPVLLNAGVRFTEAAQAGLLGFTDGYNPVFEGSVGVFLTDKLILASEFRQQPKEFKRVPGLVEKQDDWFTVLLAYVVNEHLVIGGGYANFGDVLNHEANNSWGAQVKWEF